MNRRNSGKDWVLVSLCLLWGFSGPAPVRSPTGRSNGKQLVEAGKKEGEVVIYGPLQPDVPTTLDCVSEKLFRDKVQLRSGQRSGSLSTHRCGKTGWKISGGPGHGGSSSFASFPPGTLEPLKPLLLLPEINDSSAWWDGKLHFADPQNQAAIIISGEVGTRRGSYNTKLLNPMEIQSWWDLLLPKWKGKLGSFDPRVAGGGGETFLFFYYTPALGHKFITRILSETDIQLTRDLQQGTDWLGQGKILFTSAAANRS